MEEKISALRNQEIWESLGSCWEQCSGSGANPRVGQISFSEVESRTTLTRKEILELISPSSDIDLIGYLNGYVLRVLTHGVMTPL